MGGEHVCENDNDYDDDGDDDDYGDDDDDGDDGDDDDDYYEDADDGGSPGIKRKLQLSENLFAQSSSIVRLLDSCVCFWQSVHLEPK